MIGKISHRFGPIVLGISLALGAVSLAVGAPIPDDTIEAEAASSATPPVGKLPPLASPNHYTLDMVVDPRKDTFTGTARIEIDLKEAGDGIWLHGRALDVTDVTVMDASNQSFKATWDEVLPSGVARIDFGRHLPAGAISLTITYEAAFDKLLRGLFKVNEQGDAYALAKSESIQARRYLPGFDEPGFKTPFDISLTVPKGYEAISNAPVTQRVPAGEDMETVHFAETRPLSTYLLSIAVGPFDIVEYAPLPPNSVRDHAIPLRGIARRGRGAELNYALSTTAELIEIFETALQVPYPYKKLDIIAAPQWPSGATELAGAITYRESRILYTDRLGPAARRALLGIHTHEIAHMWFGDLVTPPWWDDLWLKESFATWGTPLALTAFEPQGGHDLDAINGALRAMRLDTLGSARAVREPIDRNEDIRNAYDAITYSKGMAVISMIDAYFGAQRFRPALGRYIKAFEDGIADSADFFKVIGEVSGERALTEAFESFVQQSGLPKLKAELTCEAGRPPFLAASQSQYAPLGSPIEQGKSWAIPVCVAYGNEDGARGRSCGIIRENDARLRLDTAACPAWVMPNAGGTGYYRWDLTPTAWEDLAAHFEYLSPAEALSAVDSAVAAFEAGGGDAASLLSLLEAATRSDHSNVAKAPMLALARMASLIRDDTGRGYFNAYVSSLYKPLYTGISRIESDNAAVFRSDLEVFLARTGQDPEIRAKLARQAADFIGFGEQSDYAPLSSDLYSTAFTVGVQDLGKDFFDRLLEARTEIDDPRFEAAVAAALGSATDLEASDTVRALILDGSLGPRETYSLVAQQMNNPETRDTTWAWVQDNYPRIVANIPGTWPRRTPRLAENFCDVTRITELEALFKTHGDVAEGYERALTETIESITLCAAFKTARITEFENALIDRLNP